jgi:penicillin-binding protein 1A
MVAMLKNRWVQAGLSLALLGAVAAAIGFVAVLSIYGRGLPDYRQLADYEPPIATRIHAGDGRLLDEFAQQRRVFVPYESIPPLVVQAFVSAEDKTFFTHSGFDLWGIARAAFVNLYNAATDQRPIGASTITQQVAKNFLLTNEVSYERKIKEAILAYRIERAFSKERILELYLNEIFLGNRAYGVAAAALNYFNKSLDELSLEEAAYLAGLPKAPNNYNPARNYQAAVERRNYVLRRMYEDGYIDRASEARASEAALETRPRERLVTVDARSFTEEVRRELEATLGQERLYGGGLSVRTTLDTRLQAIAEKALREGVIAYDRRHGWRGAPAKLESFDNWPSRLEAMKLRGIDPDWLAAAVLDVGPKEAKIGLATGELGVVPLGEIAWARRDLGEDGRGPPIAAVSEVLAPGDVVLVERLPAGEDAKPVDRAVFALRQNPEVQGAITVLDPHTGRVLAMVGGTDQGNSQFNRVTQALRQPGSAFKPFVFLAGLERGFTPSTLVLDAPIAIEQGPGLPLWRPKNYSERFYGPTPIRVGMEQSRNLMTIRMAQYVGMPRVIAVAQRFGIGQGMQNNLAEALGTAETTLLQLTAAYAMLDNGGKRISPSVIDRIQDRTGATIFRHDARECAACRAPFDPAAPAPSLSDAREEVADPRHAYQLVSMLQGVIERGTARGLAELNRPLAGKTGTTDDERDAWFIGFAPDLAVGVWVGFDGPRPMGRGETGGRAAAPIFKDFMASALEGQPPTPFRVPEGVRLVRVDPASGRLAKPGERNVILEPFLPGTEPDESNAVLDGGVFSRVPDSAVFGGDRPTTVGTGGIY